MPAAIISIAQQASPKVTGQSDDLRAQLNASVSLASPTLPWTAACSSGIRPHSSGMRPSGAGNPRRRLTDMTEAFLGRGGVLAALPPPQHALLQRVDQADDQDRDEDEHLDQREQTELAVGERPWVEEHRLDVEDHEDERVDVEA